LSYGRVSERLIYNTEAILKIAILIPAIEKKHKFAILSGRTQGKPLQIICLNSKTLSNRGGFLFCIFLFQ